MFGKSDAEHQILSTPIGLLCSPATAEVPNADAHADSRSHVGRSRRGRNQEYDFEKGKDAEWDWDVASTADDGAVANAGNEQSCIC